MAAEVTSEEEAAGAEANPGELEPLIKADAAPEKAANTSALGGPPMQLRKENVLIDEASKRMSEDDYRKRRNTFTSTLELAQQSMHRSLRERRARRKAGEEEQKEEKRLTLLQVFWRTLNGIEDFSPIMRSTIQDINNTFGSGISAMFYDWRWLILINLLLWVVWFIFAIYPWLLNPPRFEDSDPPYANFWNRDDLSFSAMLTGSATAKGIGDNQTNTVVPDSFLFYTGYVDKMGTSGDYDMGATWIFCLLLNIVILFTAINQRLVAALKLRKFDPEVESMVAARGGQGDRQTGIIAASLVLGGFDHSASTHEGAEGTMKALITGLEVLVAQNFKTLAVAAQLRMGTEVFECKVFPPGHKDNAGTKLPSIVDFQQKISGENPDADVTLDECIADSTLLRRKLEAGKATVEPSEEEMREALEAYLKENPAANALISGRSTPRHDVEDLGGNRVERSIIKCILAYGSLWQIPYGAAQEARLAGGDWTPPSTWNEAFAVHQGTQRTAFIYAVRHGEAVSTTDYAKQAAGLFLTLVAFGLSGSGVYLVTNYSEMLAANFGPYCVTVMLVLIQNVIPVVVKQIVKAEGWTSEDLVLRWTLGRVYILKMANLVVLLAQLDKVGAGGTQCATLQVGLYLYQLVFVGTLSNMVSNWACFWGMYRFLGKDGPEKVEYDNQTVAQQYIELNYATALVWIGSAYSPMLPFWGSFLGLLEILWMGRVLKWFCRCAEKPFQATAETKMLVMAIFFCTFAYSCIPTCLFMYAHPSVLYVYRGGERVSTYCGPIVATERRYQVLVDYLFGWIPKLEQIIAYATNPTMLFGVIAVLSVLVAFNSEATDNVREECVEQHLERANTEAHLRERRIQNRILEREKVALKEEIETLNAKCADLEAGKAALEQQMTSSKKSFWGGTRGGTVSEEPQSGGKPKPTSCFG